MLHVVAQDWRCPDRQFFSFSQFTDLPLSSGLCKNRAAKHSGSKLQQQVLRSVECLGCVSVNFRRAWKPPLHWVQQTDTLHLNLFVLFPNIKNKQTRLFSSCTNPASISVVSGNPDQGKPSLPLSSPHRASKYESTTNYHWRKWP